MMLTKLISYATYKNDQAAADLEKLKASLSEQVKKLELAVTAESKKLLDAKDEALKLSKSLAEIQPHIAENKLRKDEVDRLVEKVKQLESQLKEAELDSVFLNSENDSNKKVLYVI